jgi:quercetin dioxygenase-like cupin family protein
MPTIAASARRRSETPNGVMTTSASPSLGGSAALSLWWVEMAAGAVGPPHVFDSEQLWSLVDGSAEIEIDGEVQRLEAGDTAVLPAGVTRRISATTAVRAVVCGYGTAIVSVPGEDAPRGTPAWIA